jgi:hypothetical protein
LPNEEFDLLEDAPDESVDAERGRFKLGCCFGSIVVVVVVVVVAEGDRLSVRRVRLLSSFRLLPPRESPLLERDTEEEDEVEGFLFVELLLLGGRGGPESKAPLLLTLLGVVMLDDDDVVLDMCFVTADRMDGGLAMGSSSC